MAFLLAPHTDISMRPTKNKEISTIDLDQLFGQHVESDFFQQSSSDDTTADPSSSDDISHLFELPSLSWSDPFETPALPNWETSIEDASWHKAAHNTLEEQKPASPGFRLASSFVYPESRGKASSSDPELFSFDDLFELDVDEPRAISQPSTPVPRIARPNRKARSSPDLSSRYGAQKISKKSSIASITSKMINPSHYHTGFQDPWTRKMEAAPDMLNLQLPPNGLHSPPPSTKLMQEEQGNDFFHRDQSYTIAMSLPLQGDVTSQDLHSSNYQLTPLASPAIEIDTKNDSTATRFQFSNGGMASAYISHQLSNAALSALQTPPPTQHLSMGAWGTDTSHPLDFSDYTASPEFQAQNCKSNGWWNGNGVSQPSTPNTQAFHTNHSRTTSQNLNFNNSSNNNTPAASIAGLGISCDTASFPGFGGDLSSSHHANGNGDNTSSFDMASYTLYNQPPTPGISIGTHPARAPSPSRSPSPSPRPRFTRRRHSQNPLHHHNNPHHHHNRQPSATPSNTSRRKSSSTSTSSHPRAASTGNVGFVNFTPSDSRKILTGVAPSGSSKTKARREKEAADKRRKLSQAAVKAVLDAGGDLGRLEKEGLLVLEG